ncbi:MAG: fatty acid desaturase [Myxococcales bacterium]|nr:MAG: fatty acid desaturase [Myxococcales bacterium]
MEDSRKLHRASINLLFLEWQTWLLALLVHIGWAFATVYYFAIPWPVLFVLGAYLVALHGSFQHETVHGHPTTKVWINTVIASLPLGLLVPYGIYRESHMRHHRTDNLSHPSDDPESFFVRASVWDRMSPAMRAYYWTLHTLAGRMLLGPIHHTVVLIKQELPKLLSFERRAWRIFSAHLIASGLVLYWVLVVCAMPLWLYLLCFVYAGAGLGLLRSYLEHQPAQQLNERTAIVDAAWPWSMLFLHNNLHVVHHEFPHMPWYQIRSYFKRHREQILGHNGHYAFSGYGEVFWRFSFRPKTSPRFPDALG